VVGISSDGVVRYSWITEISGVAPGEEMISAAIAAAKS